MLDEPGVEGRSKMVSPDEPVALLVDGSNRPQYVVAPDRRPRNTHHGDDGTTGGFTLAKTKVRYYNPDANTFVDIVDDPEDPPRDGGFRLRQRLRLRAGSRTLGLPGSKEVYRSRGISMWPPERTSEDDDKLMELLDPLSGCVEGKFDERSLIYMIGDNTQSRAVVLVSFDVGINLRSENYVSMFSLYKGIGENVSNPDRAGGRARHVSVSPVLRPPSEGATPYSRWGKATYLSLNSIYFRERRVLSGAYISGIVARVENYLSCLLELVMSFRVDRLISYSRANCEARLCTS
jgi:hypothetical protein